ncbi:hypothetical protein C8J56DRAFT_234759 [Mycena floridula]|nr:hypothetical protein C8J56DRAFT_234759 [Mycena floridula]
MLQRTRPLAVTNPEFIVLQSAGYIEYRVENWSLARDGSGRVVFPVSLWTWKDLLFTLLTALFFPKLCTNLFGIVFVTVLSVCHIYSKCYQVLYESIILLPDHGIQLETHWGFYNIRCFTSRRFIPLATLQDVIINEGLSGWNVRFYLAAINRERNGNLTIRVAFEHVLPRFPVLLEVYQGVHQMLLEPGQS